MLSAVPTNTPLVSRTWRFTRRSSCREETRTLALRPDAMMQGSQAHGVFRRANELLAELVRARGSPGDDVPFICECVDWSCFGRVTMSLEQFDRLCAAGRFALEHGHESPSAVGGSAVGGEAP